MPVFSWVELPSDSADNVNNLLGKEMPTMKLVAKAALVMSLAASVAFGAEAQSLRKMTRQLGLSNYQRQQVRQILRSGDRHDPATRARMNQQIMAILTPTQRTNLQYMLQERMANNSNYYVYDNTYPYYNNYNYPNNSGYYNYNYPYNSGYYNYPYNTYNYNSNNAGQAILYNLLNSGILNGVFDQLINR